MKSIFTLLLFAILITSCKSGPSSGQVKDDISDTEDVQEDELRGERIFSGRVIDRRKKKIAYAAVKLTINDVDCAYAYTDDKGKFEIKVPDQSTIMDGGHMEIVFKGYVRKKINVEDFVYNKSIVLSKKGQIVTKVDYKIFYDEVKKCRGEL